MGLRSPAPQPWDTPRHVAPSFARGKAWGPLPRPSWLSPLAVGARSVDRETACSFPGGLL